MEATADDDPPPEPPGVLVRSQGFREGPYAEFSVEEPIANSSRLVLPRIGILFARIFLTTVASYGGTQPCKIFDPAVVAMPIVARLSLTAIGTPASAGRDSPLDLRSSTCFA
jgi:hypothetical protein